MNNSDKKIAVTYYSEGGGKANLGADVDAYLDAQASLENLLEAMKEKGYDLGNGPLPNKTEISKLMIERGKNVGIWAPGELKEMLENGSVALIPENKYREWFNELPENRREEVIAQWGEPPGDVMVYQNETGRYIAIPTMIFGKVLLLPHPTWGRLQNNSVMFCEGSTPPHHQYIAFYMYLEKEFGADAILQIFGQASILPGKETGLSRYDWPCLMVQDMPCVGALTVEDPLGAANIKRRGFVYPIDFMTPPIVAAGLYGNLSTLEEKIVEYKQVTNPEVKREYRNSIIELCRDLHIDYDLGVDLNETISNSTKLNLFIEDVYDYLRAIKNEYMPYGLHTLSEPPNNESLVGMVESMLGDEFKNNVSAINSSEGVPTRLLTEVLLNGLSPENAQNKVLGTVSLGITQDLNLAVEYSNTIDACKIEIPRILNALEGKYIPPGPCGDPVRDPAVLPTGRNPFGFNPDKIPTKEAWGVGKNLGDQLLALHLNSLFDGR
jgi:cobaltochelatase CobN